MQARERASALWMWGRGVPGCAWEVLRVGGVLRGWGVQARERASAPCVSGQGLPAL